jgi:hypothetical protein
MKEEESIEKIFIDSDFSVLTKETKAPIYRENWITI